jgi:hypothetical protein
MYLPFYNIMHSVNCFPSSHPWHKLLYFWNAGWTEEWIATLLKHVQDQFEGTYKAVSVDEDDEIIDEVCTNTFTL